MAYIDDTKPSGSYTDDKTGSLVAWDDSVATWDSASVNWDGLQAYTDDAKGSGSYSNDTKPT